MKRFYPQGQRGFTLIEVMAALTVFTLITLGLVPLFTSSIKGTSLSRSYTAGKNIAVEAMERARGIPYFVDYPTQKAYSGGASVRKVDLLDLYLPAAASIDGGTYSAGTFTTTCTTGGANPACPRNLPSDYSMVFAARFVRPVASGSVEQYVVETPPVGYRWNPEPYASQDQPPTRMLRLAVTVQWTYGSQPKSMRLTSIIANRDFGEVAVSGRGEVGYAVQVTTQYTNESTRQKTEVVGVAGSAESEIETKTQSTADQSVNAARIDITNLPLDGSGSAEELVPVEGAASSIHAPPDSTPSGASVGPRLATHDIFGTIAGIDGTTTSDLKVSVSQELPTASGTFGFSAPTGSERLFFIKSQLGPDNASALRLDDTEGLLKFNKRGSGTISGSTLAETTAINTGSRRVLTSALAAFEHLRFLSTNFIRAVITDINGDVITGINGDAVHRSVVVVNRFSASVSCRATGSTSTASATKSWSADVYFYADTNGNDVVDGSYQRVSVGSGFSSDPLAAWGPNGTNPVVYDAPAGEEDIYLFRTADKKGYFQSWSTAVGTATNVLEGGRVARASISEAIRLVSAPTDSRYPESTMLVQIGNLGCEAQDQR